MIAYRQYQISITLRYARMGLVETIVENVMITLHQHNKSLHNEITPLLPNDMNVSLERHPDILPTRVGELSLSNNHRRNQPSIPSFLNQGRKRSMNDSLESSSQEDDERLPPRRTRPFSNDRRNNVSSGGGNTHNGGDLVDTDDDTFGNEGDTHSDHDGGNSSDNEEEQDHESMTQLPLTHRFVIVNDIPGRYANISEADPSALIPGKLNWILSIDQLASLAQDGKKTIVLKELVQGGFISEIDNRPFKELKKHHLPIGGTRQLISDGEKKKLICSERLDFVIGKLYPLYIKYAEKEADGTKNRDYDAGKLQQILLAAYFWTKFFYPKDHHYKRLDGMTWNKGHYIPTRFVEQVKIDGEYFWEEMEHSTALSKINARFYRRKSKKTA